MQDEERRRRAFSAYLWKLRLLNYVMGAVIVVLLGGLFLIVLWSAHLIR